MKTLKIIALLLFPFLMNAQVDFGIKGGITYNADEGLFKTIDNTYTNKGEGSVGFHGGIFTRIGFSNIFVQPELIYNQFNNQFNAPDGTEFDVVYKRLDVPVTVGVKFAGIARVQAGPVLSYYFEDDIQWDDISEIQQDEIMAAAQIGAGVDFLKLSVDLRYEFPFGERETEFIHDFTDFKTENSPKLLFVSIGYRF